MEGRVLFKLLHPGPEGAPPGEGTLRTAASEGPLPVSPPSNQAPDLRAGQVNFNQTDRHTTSFGSWKDCQPSEAEMRACCCKPCVHDLRRRGFNPGSETRLDYLELFV